jgi:hypothetical protein
MNPSRRKAVRRAAPDIEAYFFDGATPSRHRIRDISLRGLYLLTHHRWYPGTLVDVVLQHESGAKDGSERAVVVQSRAVRSGEDGVGFEFLPAKDVDPRHGLEERQDLAKLKDLERFLGDSAKESARRENAGYKRERP